MGWDGMGWEMGMDGWMDGLDGQIDKKTHLEIMIFIGIKMTVVDGESLPLSLRSLGDSDCSRIIAVQRSLVTCKLRRLSTKGKNERGMTHGRYSL